MATNSSYDFPDHLKGIKLNSREQMRRPRHHIYDMVTTAFSTYFPLQVLPKFYLSSGNHHSISHVTKAVVHMSSKSVDSDFSKWASSANITMPSVVLTNFKPSSKSQTIGSPSRGLLATAPIQKRSTLITVPSKSALQVTTAADETIPSIFSIPRSEWRRIPWYARLALLIINAQRDKNHPLHAWINRLPFTSVDVPHQWTDEEIARFQNERLRSLILEQRQAYSECYRRVSGLLPHDQSISKDEFISVINCVRSRAFSGPLETAPFRERLRLLIFIATNTFLWPLLNVLSWENSLNGGLTALFSLAVFDLIFPRVQKIIAGTEPKRYAVVPGIDMFNHNGIKARDSQVELRYFTDSFEVLSATDYSIDDEVYISYGAQSNDAFIQYYSFVEDDNPADDFVFDEKVTSQLGVPQGRLIARRDGFDSSVLRRVMKRIGGNKEKAVKLLREMCRAQLERFDTTAEEDTLLLGNEDASSSYRLNLAIRHRRSKKVLLQNVIEKWETES